jgi:hypothetical protein
VSTSQNSESVNDASRESSQYPTDAAAVQADASSVETPQVKSASTPCYIYAVTRAGLTLTESITGVGGAVLRSIEAEGLQAWVSDAPRGRLRPERANLTAHQRAVQAITLRADALPMAFGMVLPGPKTVKRLLAANQDKFAGELERVENALEMTLRLSLDVPNVIAHLVESDDSLRAARDMMIRVGQRRDNMIEVGKMVASTLESKRDAAFEAISSALADYSREIVRHPPKNDQQLLNLALLVDRARISEYEAAVLSVASTFDETHAFDMSGPWPPNSFVDARVTIPDPREQRTPQERGTELDQRRSAESQAA